MSVDVFLGERRSGIAIAGSEPRWSEPGTVDLGLRWIAEQVAELHGGRWRRPRATVWLSGALARPFLFGPVPGVKRFEEARQIAERIGGDATGLPQPCSAWLEAWSADRPCLAVVMGSALRRVLCGPVTDSGLQFVHVRPWWSAALHSVLDVADATTAIGIDDGESVTLLGGRGQSFGLARTFVGVSPGQGPAMLSRAVLGTPDLAGATAWVSMKGPGCTVPDSAATSLDVPFAASWSRVE